jgi:hypothetical protein
MVSESAEFKGIGANDESAEAFGSRVRRAVIWRSGSQILAQIITWGSTLLVIRLLDPSDYGLFAMTQVVLAFLAFLNGWGFASALVQSDSVDPFRIRQAFGLLLLLNALLAAIQYSAHRSRRPIMGSRWSPSCCACRRCYSSRRPLSRCPK